MLLKYYDRKASVTKEKKFGPEPQVLDAKPN
jgi:hypothetical protein